MLPNIPILEQPHIEPIQLVIKEEKKEPKKHIVQKGDTLTSISSHFNVPISRLWAANPQLTSPDLIEPEMALLVPENTDVLPERALPVIIKVDTPSPQATSGGSSVSKWTFPWGWCTYFASQARPDLPVRGNAADWIAWSNGTTPKVGAVAVNTQGYGHVAIVMEITDTQILVRHMNWKGFGVVTDDWIDRSYWSGYIY